MAAPMPVRGRPLPLIEDSFLLSDIAFSFNLYIWVGPGSGSNRTPGPFHPIV